MKTKKPKKTKEPRSEPKVTFTPGTFAELLKLPPVEEPTVTFLPGTFAIKKKPH